MLIQSLVANVAELLWRFVDTWYPRTGEPSGGNAQVCVCHVPQSSPAPPPSLSYEAHDMYLLLSPSLCYLLHNIITQETRCLGQESNYVCKAIKQRKSTQALKNHLNLRLILSFFYIREREPEGAEVRR